MSVDLPEEPVERKAIIVLSRHDLERCEYDPDGAATLSDDEIAVLSYPPSLGTYPSLALRNILDRNIARAGELLIQSPFDPDEYAPVSSASEQFAVEKHMVVSRLCQILGATSFWVEQIDLRTEKGTTSLNMKLSKAATSGGLTTQLDTLEALKRQMSLDVKMQGGLADVQAAEALLRNKRLWSDPALRALVDMRRDQSNALRSHKMVISLSSEVQANLDVAARVKLPFLSGSAKFERATSIRNEYTVTTEVFF